MKITKFVHSCLLFEMPEPENRTVLFDPGVMSTEALRDHQFEFLDDIVITHSHADHFDPDQIARLAEQFPAVRITAPPDVVAALAERNVTAQTKLPDGFERLDAPHETVRPAISHDAPEQCAVHYLDRLTHPGDSHSFSDTKEILALPVQAPWGSEVAAVTLALKLRPKHILPIHDWHWSDAARQGEYDRLEGTFAEHGMTFHKLRTAEPIVIKK